jgi:HEAT repeat protein
LSQLSARAPGPTMEAYLIPVLRRLGPALPASDVYRVFDRIPADPAIARQILPLIANLDSEDSKIRDAAATSLKALGREGVHACLRLDEAVLSPEQRNRLSAFYESEGWMHVPDVEAARRDPEFLSGCLEDQDPAVRTAATNLLAALRVAPGIR